MNNQINKYEWIIADKDKIEEYPKFTPRMFDINGISSACKCCPNHPVNGGSGICHCTLGMAQVTC